MNAEPDRSPGPDYARLSADPDWVALWTSPRSVVYTEIERLEVQLHDTAVSDADEITGLKHRIAALKWLRDTVATAADPPKPAPERPPFYLRRRLGQTITELFDRVTHPSLG